MNTGTTTIIMNALSIIFMAITIVQIARGL